jgi:hypothetical protein
LACNQASFLPAIRLLLPEKQLDWPAIRLLLPEIMLLVPWNLALFCLQSGYFLPEKQLPATLCGTSAFRRRRPGTSSQFGQKWMAPPFTFAQTGFVGKREAFSHGSGQDLTTNWLGSPN